VGFAFWSVGLVMLWGNVYGFYLVFFFVIFNKFLFEVCIKSVGLVFLVFWFCGVGFVRVC